LAADIAEQRAGAINPEELASQIIVRSRETHWSFGNTEKIANTRASSAAIAGSPAATLAAAVYSSATEPAKSNADATAKTSNSLASPVADAAPVDAAGDTSNQPTPDR